VVAFKQKAKTLASLLQLRHAEAIGLLSRLSGYASFNEVQSTALSRANATFPSLAELTGRLIELRPTLAYDTAERIVRQLNLHPLEDRPDAQARFPTSPVDLVAGQGLKALRDPRRYGMVRSDNALARAVRAAAADDNPETYREVARLADDLIWENRCEPVRRALAAARNGEEYRLLEHVIEFFGSASRSRPDLDTVMWHATFAIPIVLQMRRGQPDGFLPRSDDLDFQGIADLLGETQFNDNADVAILPVLIDLESADRFTWTEWSNHAKSLGFGLNVPQTAYPTTVDFDRLSGYAPQARLLLGTITTPDFSLDRFPFDDQRLADAITSICARSLDPAGRTLTVASNPRPILNAIGAVRQTLNMAKWYDFDQRVTERAAVRPYGPALTARTLEDGHGVIDVAAHGERFEWVIDQGEPWRAALSQLGRLLWVPDSMLP
jgi:hypothetical protein